MRAASSSARAGSTVAPAAAGLLVVGLEARGQRPVGDGAHVGLVDAHAERVGGDDDLGAHRSMNASWLARRASGDMPAW